MSVTSKCDQIIADIDLLFGDTSVSPSEVSDLLGDIVNHCETLRSAIEEDIARADREAEAQATESV